MDKDIPLGMKIGALVDAFHRLYLRENDLQEAGLIEELKPPSRFAFGQDTRYLVADPFPGNLRDSRGLLLDSPKSSLFDGKAEAGSKTHGARHPEAVLAKALSGISDGPDQPPAQVFPSADEINDLVRNRIVHHSVDGKITPQDILLHGRKADMAGPAAIQVRPVMAEGRDLKGIPVEDNQDDTELRPHRYGLGKNFLYRLRLRLSRNIVVLGSLPEEIIPHAAARQVGLVTLFPQALYNGNSLFLLRHRDTPAGLL